MSVQLLYKIYCRSEAGTNLTRSKGDRLLLELVVFEVSDECVVGIYRTVRLIFCRLLSGLRQPTDTSEAATDESPPTCQWLLTMRGLM